MHKFFIALIPPIIILFAKSSFRRILYFFGILFDGSDSLFKKSIDKDTIYGEYGSGLSTVWVGKKYRCTTYSVESSPRWAAKIANQCKKMPSTEVHYVDIGPIDAWGFPSTYLKTENFSEYTDYIWEQEKKPNVILIDGRFRICCFLTSLIHANPGSKIIFDDYTNRQIYHFVERFLKPTAVSGRQALFIVPSKIAVDIKEVKKFIELFRYVPN